MTIQEAIKSGKPFKRAMDRDNEWLLAGNNGEFEYLDSGTKVFIGINDILATDWELKP